MLPPSETKPINGVTSPVGDDADLHPSELASLKRRLDDEVVAARERLRERIAAVNEGDTDLPDEMDQATRDQERGYQLRLADKEQNLLRELEHALAKMADGTYGVCEGTDEPIGLERLKARPWARYSVEYMEQLEQEQRGDRQFR